LILRHGDSEYPFTHWLLPILLKLKDPELLHFIVRQPGYFLSHTDVHSFVGYALAEKWYKGLNVFIESPSVRWVAISGMGFETQRSLVETLAMGGVVEHA
jgi:hypothetical protein